MGPGIAGLSGMAAAKTWSGARRARTVTRLPSSRALSSSTASPASRGIGPVRAPRVSTTCSWWRQITGLTSPAEGDHEDTTSLLKYQRNSVHQSYCRGAKISGGAQKTSRRFPVRTFPEFADSSDGQPAGTKKHHDEDTEGDCRGRLKKELEQGHNDVR